jgi:hypothetical protein
MDGSITPHAFSMLNPPKNKSCGHVLGVNGKRRNLKEEEERVMRVNAPTLPQMSQSNYTKQVGKFVTESFQI